AHVARLLHDYADGKWQETDSLFTDAFGVMKSLPPDPKQLSITRIVDNPKLRNRSGIADTGTIEGRATAAVTIAPDPSNDYLVVTSEGSSPLDAAFVANLYIACFIKDNQARVRANSIALKAYLFEQKERSFDTLRRIENKLRAYLGETNGMSAE